MWLLLGKLDTSLKTAFDFDYWLRAFHAFPDRIGFIEAVQAQSRLHEACITQKMRRTVALEGARLAQKHLGRAPLHWILTHMNEAQQSGIPNLGEYLEALTEDARPYFSPEEFETLLHAATQKVRRPLINRPD
jgi:hypothetical protein